MKNVPVMIKKLHSNAIIPEYKHDGDAGFDFYTIEDYKLKIGETKLIRTGLCVSFPDDYELQVRLRSSIATSSEIIIPNAPCTIDSCYRGEIMIPVKNIGYNTLSGLLSQLSYITIPKGTRIAQGILSPVVKAVFKEVDELPESSRGEGGFGSTGK